jgi:hypothetical protein
MVEISNNQWISLFVNTKSKRANAVAMHRRLIQIALLSNHSNLASVMTEELRGSISKELLWADHTQLPVLVAALVYQCS